MFVREMICPRVLETCRRSAGEDAADVVSGGIADAGFAVDAVDVGDELAWSAVGRGLH